MKVQKIFFPVILFTTLSIFSDGFSQAKSKPKVAVSPTLSQLSTTFNADIEKMIKEAEPGDQAIDKIEKLLQGKETFQSPAVQEQATIAEASYQKALPFVWDAKIQILMALSLAPSKAKDIGKDLDKVNTLLNTLANYQRDLWKIMNKWPQKVSNPDELAKKSEEMKKLVNADLNAIDQDRKKATALVSQVGSLLEKTKNSKDPQIIQSANESNELFANVLKRLWSARIKIQVVSSYYAQGASSDKEIIKLVPEKIQATFGIINFMIEAINGLQAANQTVLTVQNPQELAIIIQGLQKNQAAIAEQMNQLMQPPK